MSWYNPYLFIPLAAWFIAHTIKFLSSAFSGDIDFRYFYKSGGMPSGHSATVLALTTTALVYAGFGSITFGVVVVFAVIVLYDSLGVRRAVGEQAQVINDQLGTKVRQVRGHEPREVITGGLLGALTGFALSIPQWANNVSWLSEPPMELERWIYLAVFAGMVLSALLVSPVFGRKFNKRAHSVKRLKQNLVWYFGISGGTGLLISLIQFQTVGSSQWRLWAILLLVVFIVTGVFLSTTLFSGFQTRYAKDIAKLSTFADRKNKRR